MSHSHTRTIAWFIFWGIIYGLMLGALCGTLLLPGFGTSYAATWGLGIGVALGIACGAGIALMNAFRFRTPYDLTRYRRGLTLGVGAFVSLGAAVLLVATTEGILWGMGSEGFLPFFLPSLLGAMFWGGLSSAYAASRYADWYTRSIFKQKNDGSVDDQLEEKMGIFERLVRQSVRPDRNLALITICTMLGFGVTWLFGFTASAYILRSVSEFAYIILMSLLFLIAALILGTMAGGYLTVFVNRIYALEYRPDLSADALQRRVQLLVCGFLALAALVFVMPYFNPYVIRSGELVGYALLIPLAIVVGWRMTRGFGEWLLREEKTKAKVGV